MANKTTIVRAPNGDPVPMVLVDNGDNTIVNRLAARCNDME